MPLLQKKRKHGILPLMEDRIDLVRAAADRLDMPVVRLPDLIRTPERTLRRWQAGGPMPGAAETLLRLIAAGKVRAEDLAR